MAKDRREGEAELFRQWRKDQDPQAFAALYTSMKPVIYRAAEKASLGSNLPQSAFKVWAAQAFHDALRTYDPARGAALNTHVHSAVEQKTKRLNYQYQNLGQMPEPRAMRVGLLQNVSASLREDLGREPTDVEVSDELGWTPREVSTAKAELRKELTIGGGTDEVGVIESDVDEQTLDFLYYDLSNEEKKVFDLLYGRHGQPKLLKPNGRILYTEVGQRSGFSASKARVVVHRIKAKLDKALKR